MKTTSAIAASIVLVAAVGESFAAPSTLTDGNSTINYDPVSQSGLSDWIVDGVDHLSHQFFWYRVNGVDTQERSFDSLTFNGATASGTDQVTLSYTKAGYFDVTVDLNLNGGAAGSGVSGLIETIAFEKDSSLAADLDVTFFQYSNFDLAGTAGGDAITLTQSFVLQRDGVTDFQESLTASLPLPVRGEVGEASTVLGKLTDSGIDDLATDFSVSSYAISSGATDAAYAWQWDLSLDSTPVILKNQSVDGAVASIGVIPEPTTLVAWLGLAAAGAIRSRRVEG